MALITITGPTGSGKTTLSKKMAEIGIHPIISCTTRPMRPGEIQGVDYFFLDVDGMDTKPLVEMVHYAGHKYGLSQEEVLRAKNQSCCVVVNPEGRNALELFCKENSIPMLTMYVTAEPEVLIQRLIDRGGDGAAFRILAAINEHAHWDQFRYGAFFDNFDGQDMINRALQRAIDWCHNVRCIQEAGN